MEPCVATALCRYALVLMQSGLDQADDCQSDLGHGRGVLLPLISSGRFIVGAIWQGLAASVLCHRLSQQKLNLPVDATQFLLGPLFQGCVEGGIQPQ